MRSLPQFARWFLLFGFGITSVLFTARGAESAVATGSSLEVVELRCDAMKDPLGVDSTPPRLSWQLRGTGRSERQSAWQVIVASSTEALAQDRGDLWDSGRVGSDAQLWIPYGGKPLSSGQRVFWKVRIWDGREDVSAWSSPATWTMGVLRPGDWKAHWITDSEFLRGVRPKFGFRSLDSEPTRMEKWIQLDLGSVKRIETIKLHAIRVGAVERMGFPQRFKVEVSRDENFASGSIVADYTAADYPERWASVIELALRSAVGRYVKITSARLPVVEGRVCLAFSQIEVLSAGKNVALQAKVKASDSREDEAWSAAAVVDGMGLPGANPVANATLLARHEFPVREGLRRALIFVSGLGQYELTINGSRIGTGLLTPGWTVYDKTRLYDTYDVTAQLETGANAVGLILGNGMYNVQEGRYVKFVSPFRPLTAIAQLQLQYADGTVETIGSDETWRVAKGPITFSNIYGGEDYDARLEPSGWDKPNFKAPGWASAVLAPAFTGSFRGASESSPAFRTYETFVPVTTKALRRGVSVCDFGQNAAMMPHLRIRGSAGARVKLIPAELVDEEGQLDRASCAPAGAETYWSYTFTGGGKTEEWFPKFFYQGYRYLQVELTPAADGRLPVVESLQSVVVHSDSPAAGDFSCSNDLFNRIHNLIRWAQRSNLAHVITDCPHRERLGWLEQYHLNGPALRYDFDLTRLYAKSFQDMEDSQLANGLVPDIAPEYIAFGGGFRDSPEWGAAFILAAWQHYVWTGDTAVLGAHYGGMANYLRYLDGRAQDGIVSHGLGDWYDIGPKPPGVAQLTPVPLTATAIYYECTRVLASIAAVLGKSEEVRRHNDSADRIRDAFNRRFFNNGAGAYAAGSQTSQAMPLVLGLPGQQYREAVLATLVRDIQTRGNAVSAGDVGYRYVLRALADEDRSDVIFAMNNQSDKPGYGYQLSKGCTSLAEAWNADRTSSQNHFMLGQLMEWFYHDLAGLSPDPRAPGFKRIVVRPQPVAGVDWTRVRYQSPRGPIAVMWKKLGERFALRVEIPPNVGAELWLPMKEGERVEESGEAAFRRPGVRLERRVNGYAILSVESGNFDFVVGPASKENENAK